MKKIFFILTLSFVILFNNNMFSQTASKFTFKSDDIGKTFYADSAFVANMQEDTNTDTWITYCLSPSTMSAGRLMTFTISEVADFDKDEYGYVSLFYGKGIDDLNRKIPIYEEIPEDMKLISTDGDTLIKTNYFKGKTYETKYDDDACFTLRILRTGEYNILGNIVIGQIKIDYKIKPNCIKPQIDLAESFKKSMPNGDTKMTNVKNLSDTVYNSDGSIYEIFNYKAVDFCIGDSLTLFTKLKPQSIEDTIYQQDFSRCYLKWDLGDPTDVNKYYTTDIGVDSIGKIWRNLMGYRATVTAFDTSDGGCSGDPFSFRVRVSKSPIKVVNPIPEICSGELFLLNTGYSADNIIVLDTLRFPRNVSADFSKLHYITDPGCGAPPQNFPPPLYGSSCYQAQINFAKFNEGETLKSGSQIKSVCLNIEHSAVMDLSITVRCPDYNHTPTTLIQSRGARGGSFGEPVQGTGTTFEDYCYPEKNPANKGYIYCWSEIYHPNRGKCEGRLSRPVLPSDTATHYNYFIPINSFDNLIGCPLNGIWTIEVCDHQLGSTGWVHDAWIDLESLSPFEYPVNIEKVIWTGENVKPKDKTSAFASPDIKTEGVLKYSAKIIDDFGCEWDTVTNVNVIRTPVVNLNNEDTITVCDKTLVTLDAGNDFADTFIWSHIGTGAKTTTINAIHNNSPLKEYKVKVMNKQCFDIDSVFIKVHPTVTPSFDILDGSLEGCEPLHLKLKNTSSDKLVEWQIGQYTSKEQTPSFNFASGNYDIILKVTSPFGCADSLTYSNYINVFKTPKANFSWNPEYPFASDPSASFNNLTSPKLPNIKYHWYVQAYKNRPDLIENIIDVENPNYKWTSMPNNPAGIAGDYIIKLDAYSVNNSKGHIYECHDTISKAITIINDILLFPNVITPNGDGVNDIFEIHNLIEGQAFPDNELAIYNRYGKRIYFVEDIRSKDDFWDPRKTNTTPGTYFYKFIGRGPIRNIEYSGSLEILK